MAKKDSDKLEEANFEVSSLDEVKDENGNGIFHMRTKTKIIAAISAVILLIAMTLIFLTVKKYFDAQMWQVAVWGLCGILSLYAIFAKSIAALLLNIILFLGLSFFPIWESNYEKFQPVIEKFSSSEETPAAEEKSPIEEKNPPAEKKSPEKVETPPAEKNSDVKKSDDEKIPEPPMPTI